MTTIKQAILPKDPRGNDPNDWRGEQDFMAQIRPAETNGLNWTEQFTVTTEEAAKYDTPKWHYPNLIIKGHFIVIPAQPNGGKTTICMHIASELARNGLSVYYVNADVGQTDAKAMVEQADHGGFTLLLPDMKAGLSMQDVVDNLEQMNETGGDFSNVVFFFDTLKKMTDVINKSRAKELYKTLRSLSAKGMTIVLLAHTNKYADADGKPIFEGTADLRSDVDELIYFIPKRNEDGSMTVSTEPDKVRGKFNPITFDILPDRTVCQRPEYVDVARAKKEQEQREADSPAIELITQAINAGELTEAKILAHVRNSGTGIGRRNVMRILARYQGRIWGMERAFQNNAKQYFLLERSPG